ncbi:hypothetical protein Ct9H90mP29_08520 [bacterium]|nr:MAG: hypothetical protein Ct9H90mP29_08520 [bacterium]
MILSFQSAAFNEKEMLTGSSTITTFDVELDVSSVRSTSEEPFQEAAGDVDLENAELLVSVGRGIEKEEKFT